LNNVITAVQPSLENNESEGPSSPVKEYFDQIRDCLEQVSGLYSQTGTRSASTSRHQRRNISDRCSGCLGREQRAQITAVLPSVKLPAGNAWMSHTEWAGSDGTIQVAITEAGPAVLVHQSWTGGDGSMAGTVVVTIVPFDHIGRIHFHRPMGIGDDTWTVVVESSHASFPETLNSHCGRGQCAFFPPSM